MEKIVKINLGCGTEYREGWINVDKDLNVKTDVCCDIKTFSTIDNSVDEILLSHVVMYLRPEELQPLLLKCRNWLKEGGKMTIETCDLRKIAKIILEESDPHILYVYGLINLFGKRGSAPHRWGWTVDRLTMQLYQAGFKELVHVAGGKKMGRDYILIATK